MITIYEIGSNGIWTGETQEIGEADGVFEPWTRSPVPELSEGEYALWRGSGVWVVVTEIPVDTVPVPVEISASQFFRALWKTDRITFDECRAALKTGDLPAAMAAMVDKLPLNERQDALLIIEGATTFRRAHPLVPVFAQLYGLTSDETDDLWRAASALP